MAGRVQWEAQVDSNVAKLLGETKELRNELETISKKDIKLDIDSKSLNSIVDLFGKMESHLKDLKKVFVDVGDGAEFSPLLKTINNIQSSIDKVSASVKNIGFNMNIDFGSDAEMEAKIQSKISNALQAYQRLFDHIKMSSAGGTIINTKFFDFDINQYDTMMGKLQAYKKFIENMRNEAKAYYGGQDVLFQDTEKSYWTSASAAMGQVTKAFNEMNASADTKPLDNLFGKTDLTEVVSQLGLIVNKLEEISSMASKLAKVDVSPTPIKDTIQGETKASAESSASAVKEEAKAIEQVAEKAEKASKGKDKFAKANKKVKESADASVNAVKEEKITLSSMQSEIDKYNKKYKDLNIKPSDENRSIKYQNALNTYKKSIEELEKYYGTLDNSTPITSEQISKWKELTSNVNSASDALKTFSAAEKGSDANSRMKEIDKLTKYLEANTRISKEAKQQLQGYLVLLKSGDPSVNVKELHTAWTKVAVAEREAGREGKRFWDILTDKAIGNRAAQLVSYYLSFTDILRYGSEGVQVIRELDTALTEMRKVSDESVASLKRFQDASFDLANDVGTTAKQIQNSTADWMEGNLLSRYMVTCK